MPLMVKKGQGAFRTFLLKGKKCKWGPVTFLLYRIPEEKAKVPFFDCQNTMQVNFARRPLRFHNV